MQVTTELLLPEVDVATLYPMYLAAFQPLLTEAAARHVLTRSEFAAEMVDPRIEKIVVRDGGQVLALTTLTTELPAVPWINPTYFATMFPDAATRGAVFYLGYTLVDPGRRPSNALLLMAAEVNRRLADARGVVAYDICAFNDAHGVGRLTSKIFSRALEIRPLDVQTYYAADYRGVPSDAEEWSGRLPEQIIRTTTLGLRPDLLVGVRRLLEQLWPAALRPGGSDEALGVVLARAPERQVLLVDENDRVQAAGLCVPRSSARPEGTVPPGWDEAVRQAATHGDVPGAGPLAFPLIPSSGLNARAATRAVLEALLAPLPAEGTVTLLVAVRPERKRRYTLFPLEEYLGWRTDRGEVLDPEIRTHLALGGKVVATSEPETRATRQEWERRLGQALPADGSYDVRGAAAPLVLASGTGRYRDPQVWIAHRAGPGRAAQGPPQPSQTAVV